MPGDLVPPFDRAPDFVWSPDEVRAVWAEEGLAPVELAGATELSPLPQGQPFSFDAQRPAIAARGLSEAENELAGCCARSSTSSSRSRIAARRSGSRRCCAASPRRCSNRVSAEGADVRRLACAPRLRLARARGRAPARHAGLPQAPAARDGCARAARCRASPTCAPATTSSTRTTGSRSCKGFETKEVAGVTRDYLLLAYRGDDRVYVPHEQIGKVSRYIGADSKAPALSKLGGKAWDNLKTRARAHLREMAGELLQLYAQRQTQPGVAYDVDHEWVERLESEFPYRETEDQRTAIEAVKEDLESPHPMDRLVCGDVGFGKTEVAVRAAFAVAVNGKQVLMLVPTTVLAQQHWNTFRDRYRDFPVRVEMVSRFRKPADVKKVLADFDEGKVDVLIGTHRVLSRDVIPKELGMVVVDEEQRFGVAQKELLRQLRLEVDVLALSATPIPRTLHMSLAGLRDISVIETPPEGRRPIRTYVGEYDEDLIKQALEREIERNGQAFYLHNRVETIEEAAEKLQQLCPNLRFLVAHGQMPERELEDQMLEVPRRRRRRARLDDDHRVGARHPAGEHADRRARRPARPGAALPDPRARRPQRSCSRTPTSSIRRRAS